MEFDLLKVFAEHPGKALSRDRILTLTRNREWDPYDRSIDIRIARLRRKVEADPENPQAIRTVRGVGYMFVPAAGVAPGAACGGALFQPCNSRAPAAISRAYTRAGTPPDPRAMNDEPDATRRAPSARCATARRACSRSSTTRAP